ncbi:MAG: hypothetical protein U9O64_06360 [Campylobacterota bacterium]|nr:hypothetical protein [Campylobacterota bacterium]
MKKIELEIKDDYLDSILNFLKLLPQNVVKIKEFDTTTQEYTLWSDKELEHLSHTDLSTPLEDNEDYTKW